MSPNLDHAPQLIYQGQSQHPGHGLPKSYPGQYLGVQGYIEQGQYQVVVVKERHRAKNATAGCTAGCYCCGCRVM